MMGLIVFGAEMFAREGSALGAAMIVGGLRCRRGARLARMGQADTR